MVTYCNLFFLRNTSNLFNIHFYRFQHFRFPGASKSQLQTRWRRLLRQKRDNRSRRSNRLEPSLHIFKLFWSNECNPKSSKSWPYQLRSYLAPLWIPEKLNPKWSRNLSREARNWKLAKRNCILATRYGCTGERKGTVCYQSRPETRWRENWGSIYCHKWIKCTNKACIHA